MGWFETLFGKKSEPTTPSVPPLSGTVYNMSDYNGWGASIGLWNDWNPNSTHQDIYGHMSNPKLRIGDEIRMNMSSGKIGRFIIDELRYMGDPHDQFFGKMGAIGYVEESQ